MRTLLRLLLVIGCAEYLLLLRRRLGCWFVLALGGVILLKAHLLAVLPVSEAYQALYNAAVFALGVSLLGRVLWRRMRIMYAGTPWGSSGVSWLRLLGLPEGVARGIGEPLLALVFAMLAAGSPLLPRLLPPVVWPEVMDVVTGLPLGGLRDRAALVAYGLPVAGAVALALLHRLGIPRAPRALPMAEAPLTFSLVRLPKPKGRLLPVPSALRMAVDVHLGGKEKA